MQIIRGLRPGKSGRLPLSGCVLTVGNFDGVHRGHQQLLDRIRRQAERLAVPSAVMIFEPMPREFFQGEAAPARISSLREKLEDLRALGVDQAVLIRFDREFAAMTREAFAQLLVDRLRARYVVLGHDFRFGAGRQGDFDWLREFAATQGCEVEQCPAYRHEGERVSSTLIRERLTAGAVQAAAALLGRDYRISGRVARGQQLARTLGMPTANIVLRQRRALRYGIYAVRVLTADGGGFDGVASVGVRPTVNGRDCWLEVHLFDFAGDLYGQRLEVQFVAFLRDEARFDSLDALRAQMHRDAEQARACLQDRFSKAG